MIKLYNPQFVIFLDCGSNSYQALKFVKSKNIGSLIIDHHNTQKPYPISDVFINPKKKIGYEKFDYFCTVFLKYLFLNLYIKKINCQLRSTNLCNPRTVADVMPIEVLIDF